jgi:hypothetical protein
LPAARSQEGGRRGQYREVRPGTRTQTKVIQVKGDPRLSEPLGYSHSLFQKRYSGKKCTRVIVLLELRKTQTRDSFVFIFFYSLNLL